MFYLFFVCLIQREFDLLILNARSLKFLQNLPITKEIWWCFKKYDTTLNVPIIDIKES